LTAAVARPSINGRLEPCEALDLAKISQRRHVLSNSARQMKAQLYFDDYRRNLCVSLTTVYIDGVRERIIPSFNDYDERAEQARDDYLQELMSSATESTDGESIYESAFAHGLKNYLDGIFLSHQMIAISSAGLYHLWERLIKSFIAEEADKDRIQYEKSISKWNMYDIASCLAGFGHNIKDNNSWKYLNRLRLVSNAVKHGPGLSKRELLSEWPEVFSSPHEEQFISSFYQNEIHLEVDHFDQLAKSVCLFWDEMPERLTHTSDGG
jgi:hypothetical protein